jgi:hypothetical protein
LQEADNLAVHIGAITRHVNTLKLQAQCYFYLDRWDEVLAVHKRCWELGQRQTPEQMRASCMVFALGATVWALRGDVDQARAIRDKAYSIMVDGSGDSPENWGRTEHY